MLWYKHFADARQHPKIKKLEKIFGHPGYSVYFKTFEIISQYGGKGLKLSLNKYGINEISDDFQVSKEDLIRIWEEMIDMGSLSKRWFNKGYLYSSKLKEYQDEYSRKLLWEERRKKEKLLTTSSKNRTEQKRIYKNRIDVPSSNIVNIYKDTKDRFLKNHTLNE